MIVRPILRTAFLFATALFSSNTVVAVPLRIVLLNEINVQGDTIFLSHLVPQNAPQSIREASAKISLGVAPHAGFTRHLSRLAILTAIQSGGLPISDFSVPEWVTVHRTTHVITREESFAAIQAALAGKPVADFPSFQLSDFTLEAAVLVPSDEPQLEVTQMFFDRFTNMARFRLRSKSTPSMVPFFASTKLDSSYDDSTRLPLFIAAKKTTFPTFSSASPMLVTAGHSALLHLLSRNSDMRLEVKVLQPGRLNDTIRVRLLGTGKTFHARVVGDGELEAVF